MSSQGKLNALLESVLDLPETERQAYLIRECGHDSELLAKIQAVLGLEAEAARWLPDQPRTIKQEDRINTSVGPYQLTRLLGQGGMGQVYLGVRNDAELEMTVAVKLLRQKSSQPETTDRFRRERQILADLKHPHIAILHDVGRTDLNEPYFIMEYVDGLHVDQWVRQEQPALDQILHLVKKAAGAVGYAHENGVVHRDIKPGNLMVTPQGEPKLLDFGIAWSGESEDPTRALTPAYAAPEQLRGGTVTPAWDVYALGLVLLQLLTHKHPNQLKRQPLEEVTTLMQVGWTQPPAMEPTELPESLPESLGYVLRSALAPNPEQRYANARLFMEGLDRVLDQWERPELPKSPKTYDVLLWGHPADQNSLSQWAHGLASQNLEVWFNTDPENHQAMETALNQSRTCLICLGSKGSEPWTQNTVMRDAVAFRAQDLRILPVLLPNGPFPEKQSALPSFLRGLAWQRLSGNPQQDLRDLAQTVEGVRKEDLYGSLPAGACPFRGLEAFREEDRHLFFGREHLTQRIGEYLETHHFLALVGPSGSGKSSVARAGVLPWLKDWDTLPVVFTPNADPRRELTFALAVASPETQWLENHDWDSHHAMADALEKVLEQTGASKLCLMLDQAEELFTLAWDPQRTDQFLDALCAAVERLEGKLLVLVTMRSDFLGKCTRHLSFNHLVSDHFLQIPPMNRQELTRAVESPCRMAGLALENGLLKRILDDIMGEPGDLPLLEHALLELFERRRGSLLTLAAYGDIGGIHGALAKRAQSEYQALSPADRQTLRKMFTLCLVQPGEGSGDTRRRASWEELSAVGNEPQQIEAILERWTRCRLLTVSTDPQTGTRMIDPAHEALIHQWPAVAEWMREDRQTARQLSQVRRDAKIWDQSGRRPDYLPHGMPLTLLSELVDRESNHLGPLEKSFTQAALARRRRQTRLKQLLTALAFAIPLAFAIFLSFTNARLQKERDVAAEVTDFYISLFEAANPTRALGETITAQAVLNEGVQQLEARLKEEHQSQVRAKILSGLSEMYVSLGLYDKARPLVLELLDIRRKHPENPKDLIEALNRMGSLNWYQGSWREGLEHGQEAMELAKQYAPDTGMMAAISSLLGMLNQELGHLDQAESWLHQALQTRIKILGQTHWLTAKSHDKMGLLLQARGRYEEAQDHFEQALNIRKKVFGDNHPTSSYSYNNLGLLLQDMGKPGEAVAHHRKALEIATRVFGENHPTTAVDHQNLSLVLQKLGSYDQAMPHAQKALEIHRITLGETHLSTARSLNNVGLLLMDMGDLESAEPYLYQALEINREQLGEDNPDTARSLNNLALLLQEAGDLEEAEPYYRQSLAIRKKLLGLNHPDTQATIGNMGYLLRAMGDLKGAEPYYQQALDITLQTMGSDHPNTALSYNNLGVLQLAMNHPKKAQSLLEQAVKINTKMLGPNHPHTGVMTNNLADAMSQAGASKEAKPLIEKALTVLTASFPEDHWRISAARSIEGYILTELGETDRGLSQLEAAYKSLRASQGPNHKSARAALDRLIRGLDEASQTEKVRYYRRLKPE